MYLNKQQLIERFGADEVDDLTHDLNESAAAAKIDNAIGDAEALVNSYLAVKYTVPLVSSTALVARYVGDVARFYLYDDAAPQEVRERYEDTIKLLKDIAAGKAHLAGAADESIDQRNTDQVRICSPKSNINWGAY